jgi:DNA-binding transcriptional LysR family regulator
MELRELAAFREVARQSSFSQAAARLGYVQSTVSAQVRVLEEDLGVRLIDRLGRTIALTMAGEALLPYAERLLELASEARAAATQLPAVGAALTGIVHVSAPESLLTYRLPHVLSRFRADYPAVHVQLHPTPVGRFRGETRRAVASGAVELAVVLDARRERLGFGAEILRHEPISVIAPVDHPLASKRQVKPSDLKDETILLPEAPESGCEYRGQFERQLAGGGVGLETALEFASIETVKQCVIAGMGLSVLPSVAVEADILAARLVALAWREPFAVYTQFVWNARRSISPAQAAFMRTAREVLGEEEGLTPTEYRRAYGAPAGRDAHRLRD